jgi:hypothetical protein
VWRVRLERGGRSAGCLNGQRAAGRGNPVRLRGEGQPPEGKPWTWLRDETSLQGRWRSKPSRACETLRTDRRDRSVGAPVHQWTTPADVAKRDCQNPQEGARAGVVSSRKARGGFGTAGGWWSGIAPEKTYNARGSSNPIRKCRGTAAGKVRRWHGKSVDHRGSQDDPVGPDHRSQATAPRSDESSRE